MVKKIATYVDTNPSFVKAAEALDELMKRDSMDLNLLGVKLNGLSDLSHLDEDEQNVIELIKVVKQYIDGQPTRMIEFTKLGYIVEFVTATVGSIRKGRTRVVVDISGTVVKGRF